MVIRRTFSNIVFDIFNYIILIALALVCIYPLYYVLVASLSDSNQLVAHSGMLLRPLGFNLESYKRVFEYPIITRSYLNTIIIVASATTLNLIMTIMGAYFLSRKGLSLVKVFTGMIVFTMFFSGGLIPKYLTVKALGLYNSWLALILPVAINTFNLIIMRTTLSEVPVSLTEAAEIDGANDLLILFRIVVPVCMPTVAVIILYYGVQHWNAWFDAMIYLKDRNMYPIQLVLREILINNTVGSMSSTVMDGDQPQLAETIKYATVIVATLPILCIYPLLQKYFVKGVMIGSVKE